MQPNQSTIAAGDRAVRAAECRVALAVAVVALGSVAAAPAVAANWRTSASAGLTETYTNNVDYSSQDQKTGDFATALTATLGIHGAGARLTLDGTISVTGTWYGTETQNNSIAPNVNLTGSLEAIENFAFIDATANISQTFASPFGPQPSSNVNSTANRYTQQSYTVSPYIKGVLGPTNISYELRDDNYWTVASSFGNSSVEVPSTYANQLTGSMSSGTNPVGWRLEYDRFSYDSGIQTGERASDLGSGTYTTQVARAIISHQADPQLTLSARLGYQRQDFPLQSSQSTIYGAGFQWKPTDRTNVSGYWEHQFFGSAYEWNLSHRLPNAAISASFSRGLTSYPQLALSIPAGASVTSILDAAFTTRIPDPVARQQAIDQFLLRTGLPPTLAAPVNFYGNSIVLQDLQNVSLVLIGVRNSLSFTIFNSATDAISASGEVLPPEFQFGQNSTQTGGSIAYTHQLSGFTSLGANLSYSRTGTDQTSARDFRSNNASASLTLSTQFSPRTSGTAAVSYSVFRPTGAVDTDISGNADNTSSVNVSVGITHTFW